jgi:hypothetical protein
MFERSFRPQLEELGRRCLPSGSPAISISDVAMTEGSGGQTALVFTVSLSAASPKEVSVNYATKDGSAKTGAGDYTGASGVLRFAPGETSKTITVLVNGDTVVEGTENFFVNLSRAGNAVIADAQGVGTIWDDDTARDGGGQPTIPPPATSTPPPVEAPPDNRDDF